MRQQVKRAFKYRFYPTDEQAQELARTFGCIRKVYNLALGARAGAGSNYTAVITNRVIHRLWITRCEGGHTWDCVHIPCGKSALSLWKTDLDSLP